MNRTQILTKAQEIVNKDRNTTHGEPEDSFTKIAKSWSAKLGITITPAQASLLLADLKICRAWDNPTHEDNWIDLAGYGACGGELATKKV